MVSIYGPPQPLATLSNLTLNIDGISISPKSGVSNLGVLCDPGLSMKSHVTAVSQAGYHELFHINCIRPSLTTDAAGTAINAFVMTRIDPFKARLYGLPNSTLSKLHKLQNSAALTLTGT